MEIEIYTDGGCSPNPGKGGYGIVMLGKECRVEMRGGEIYTTNNRMEMMAVLIALKHLPVKFTHPIIYSDSKYVINGLMGWCHKWRQKGWTGIKNPDLWQWLYELSWGAGRMVEMKWVKGHRNNRWNERADRLATQGRFEGRFSAQKLPLDHP
jgi:ribonuclease HI